jgi:hypothetical protein
MRPTLLALPLLAALAAPLAAAAQLQRFSISAHRGYAAVSPVLKHYTREVNTFEGTDFSTISEDSTRLAIEGSPTTGVRVVVPLGARWSATLDGAYGTTHFRYSIKHVVVDASDPEFLWSEESIDSRMDASVGVVALGVARRVPLALVDAEAEAGLGGTLTLLRLERPACEPLPPSSGGLGSTCGDLYTPEGLPWEHAYDVPGVTAHVALRRRVWSRVGVEGRAAYTLGSASTGTFADRNPGAPSRQAIHGTQLSAGLSVGF